jgi:hypothetical protein
MKLRTLEELPGLLAGKKVDLASGACGGPGTSTGPRIPATGGSECLVLPRWGSRTSILIIGAVRYWRDGSVGEDCLI